MKISYEFQGHSLIDWAESGGLPIWVSKRFPKRIFAICNDFAVSPKDGDEELAPEPIHIHFISLRYTDPKDIMHEAPEWAESLIVTGRGTGVFVERTHDRCGRMLVVQGHLFEYQKPIRIER